MELSTNIHITGAPSCTPNSSQLTRTTWTLEVAPTFHRDFVWDQRCQEQQLGRPEFPEGPQIENGFIKWGYGGEYQGEYNMCIYEYEIKKDFKGTIKGIYCEGKKLNIL